MKIKGTPERPRLAARRTARHIYCQIIDDTVGQTLAAVTTDCKSLTEGRRMNWTNIETAKKIGAASRIKFLPRNTGSN